MNLGEIPENEMNIPPATEIVTSGKSNFYILSK